VNYNKNKEDKSDAEIFPSTFGSKSTFSRFFSILFSGFIFYYFLNIFFTYFSVLSRRFKKKIL
jgi:hypothetical protein